MELTNEFRVGVPIEQAWTVLTDVERIAPCMPGAELQEVEGDEYRGVVKIKVGPITAQYKGRATFVERDASAHKAVLRAEGRDTRGQGNANATITAVLAPDAGGTRVSVVTDLAVTGRVAQFGRGVLADVSAKLLGQFVECLESTVLSGEEPSTAGAATDAAESRAAGDSTPEVAPTPADVSPVAAGDAAPAPAAEDGEPAWAPAAASPASAAEAVDEGGAVDVTSPASNGARGAARASGPAAATGTATATPAASEGVAPPGGDEDVASSVRQIQSRPAVPVDLLDAAGGSVAKRVAPALGAVLFLLWIFRWRRKR